MKGNIRVLVSTKRLRYELNLRRNITIIQGDSASGKTTMIQIISDYLSGRSGPGTEVVCDRNVLCYQAMMKVCWQNWACRKVQLFLWMNRSVF